MKQQAPPGQLIDVAVPLPVNATFTYAVPPQLAGAAAVGMRVLAPFGRRLLTGYAVGFPAEAPPGQKIKEICDVLDAEPLFTEADLRFFAWTAAYYLHPLGLTIRTALPAGLNIEYIDVFSLTAAGREALAAGAIPGCGLAVAKALAAGKPLSAGALEKRAGRQGLNYGLRVLQEQGLVEAARRKRAGAVGIKTEKWLEPAPGACPEKLRGRQREVFGCIAAGAPLSMSSLRLQAGQCSAQIAALEAKGLILATERECLRKPPGRARIFSEPVHTPTPGQQAIIDGLAGQLDRKSFHPLLLHGVTGSGKTEIYLAVMARLLAQGRQCLYLVPEIALTAQLYDRISSRLQAPIAMLHSSLTDAERYDAWRMIRRGAAQVVVGARSAVFASFRDLGAIIVDEEHDSSYKQDDGLRYNARDLALVKARDAACPVILGSATPSLESYANAETGKYLLAELKERVESRGLPAVTLIDMKVESALRGRRGSVVSRPLRQALGLRLERGEQSLLFLNRRGFAPVYLCRQCGHTLTCPNCSVSLIHHLSRNKLACHYCDHSAALPRQCPSCQGLLLESMGWGTERLEAELHGLFPKARVARMDRDSTARPGAAHELLRGMHEREIDILIGTQMIVKGYHLPGVTLVGVISADQSLGMPDYRAAERTFQILTQVAGRSGRGELPGEVIVQTHNPAHYSITCAARHDYAAFFEHEIRFRRELFYPPLAKLVNIRFEGPDEAAAGALAVRFGETCRKSGEGSKIEILGPARAPWEKVKGRYRFQLLLKGAAAGPLKACAGRALQAHAAEAARAGVKVAVDVDPMLLM